MTDDRSFALAMEGVYLKFSRFFRSNLRCNSLRLGIRSFFFFFFFLWDLGKSFGQLFLFTSHSSSELWGRDDFDALPGARMERRPASGVGLGLSHADALHKLKRDLSDVSQELKTALRRGESIAKDDDDDDDDAEDGVAKEGKEKASRISIVRASAWRISTAIPFDFWSLALLVVSVVLLLVSQV